MKKTKRIHIMMTTKLANENRRDANENTNENTNENK